MAEAAWKCTAFSVKKSFVWLDKYPLVFFNKNKVHVLRLHLAGSIKLPWISSSFVLQWCLITCSIIHSSAMHIIPLLYTTKPLLTVRHVVCSNALTNPFSYQFFAEHLHNGVLFKYENKPFIKKLFDPPTWPPSVIVLSLQSVVCFSSACSLSFWMAAIFE